MINLRTSLEATLWMTLSLVVASACTGISDLTLTEEEQFGSMEITTVTTGTMLDPDGYTVSIDEGTSEPIGINGMVVLSTLRVGRYDVTLSDVAGNCIISGSNPRLITVTVDNASEVIFDVTCT